MNSLKVFILLFYWVIVSNTSLAANPNCQKFNGKYIAYYSDVFLVKGCKRIPLTSDEELKSIQSNSGITEVDSDVIKSIPLAKEKESVMDKRRSCKSLEGKYVTHTLNEIYFIEKCKKRLFVDWESYLIHKKKLSQQKANVIELTWAEFSLIQEGEKMPSETDSYFASELSIDGEINVLPIEEACQGLNGKYISFYSEIFKIENCRKRNIQDLDLLKKIAINSKILEIDSSRFISIPEGKPFP